MAIIDGIRGLQVEIKIGGKTAEEHDPLEKINKPSDLEFHIPDSAGSETPRSDSDIPYVVKFIEATPGALFYIQVNQLLDFKFSAHHIGFSITVDSLIMGVNHDECEKNRQLGLPWNPKASHWISKNEAGVWQRNYFQFAQLPIDDENECSWQDMETQVERTKNVGVIRIFFYHLEASNTYSDWIGRTPENARPIRESVSEKALKGRSVDCQLDWKSTPTQEPAPYKAAKFADNLKRPFALYEFRYRTMEGLMREGVVARPANNVQPQSQNDVPRTTLEAAQHEVAQHGTARQSDIRQTIETAEPPRGIKRERDSETDLWNEQAFVSHYKSRRLENGVLEVDLTDQD